MSLDTDYLRTMRMAEQIRSQQATRTSAAVSAAIDTAVLNNAYYVERALRNKLDSISFLKYSNSKPLLFKTSTISEQKLKIVSNLLAICFTPLPSGITREDCLYALSQKLTKSRDPMAMTNTYFSHELDVIDSLSSRNAVGKWMAEYCLFWYKSRKDKMFVKVSQAFEEAVEEVRKSLANA